MASSARPRIRQRTKRIAYVNQKGGVGKTTWTINVGAAAAELGARVLIREMDPQANSASSVEPEDGEYTMNDVMRPEEETGEVVPGSLGSAIRRTGKQWPGGLWIVPAELALASRENDNGPGAPRERRLQIVSEGVLDPFDLVLTDCPPNVGQLTINALADSDEAHIVTSPTKWGVEGSHQAHRTIRMVQRHHNADLIFGGVWVNMYQTAGKNGRVESRTRVAELRAAEHFTGKIHDPIVHDMEVIRRAAGASVPLSAYGNDKDATEAAAIFRGIAERALND
ncbi:ParA family protein [Streptomyces sp. MBT53]|uniref:ParA family protein n=1 Tax=Streptomyces sp. MBT53 TaxID=1488384 RepID=UPI0019118087|nr:ParA family protein [Streptomyces sp. MBT53]MBK6015912.1 AAA family ATPase [Streptomyces sp. MBT53]